MALQMRKISLSFTRLETRKSTFWEIKENYCSKKPLDISQLSTSCLLCLDAI
ncbi:Uncharacterised protein [Escherichia coli]|uniref:Uncharacterized protein n=1 Tax=Escherichia coli TaxID=562 RepID=A0A376ZZK0_ECOLX|nr:Uncharacterised protein [Escherichia coli]